MDPEIRKIIPVRTLPFPRQKVLQQKDQLPKISREETIGFILKASTQVTLPAEEHRRILAEELRILRSDGLNKEKNLLLLSEYILIGKELALFAPQLHSDLFAA